MKEAWILGGSSGLGLELAKEALHLGIKPVVFGREGDYKVDLNNWTSVAALCKFIKNSDEDFIKNASFFIWNAGFLEYNRLDAMKDFAKMMNVNVRHPTEIIQAFIARKKFLKSPFHLVTIASVAVWKARPNMAVYAACKAYQAQFSRCLSAEIDRDIPGSKVAIVHPAGMKTGIFPSYVDTSNFMDPKAVAGVIWKEVLAQEKPCDWFNILRQGSEPTVSRGNFAPGLAYDELPGYNTGSSQNQNKEEADE